MVPEHLRGVWRRQSIALDGGPATESAEVIWLQAPESFADLRVPLDGGAGIEAFAGTTTWDAPRLTWDHTIDWRGGFAGYDCGVVEWRDGALIEQGTFDADGRTWEYEEVWDRCEPGADYAVCTGPGAIVVRVGSYSLALRDRRSDGATFDVRAARSSPEHGWRDTHVFGNGAALPLAEDAPATPGWRLTELSPTLVPR